MPRIAIVGASHPHVEYVLDELRREDRRDFTVVGVEDSDPQLALRYAESVDAPAFERVADVLETHPDIVMIAGRYGDRGSDTVAALRAGAHVIADKPLCTTLEELDAIERAVAETGLSVTLLLEKRGYPETRAALEIVRAGELGDVVGITSAGPHKLNRAARPAWFFQRDAYGGILGDLAIHDLDAALLFAPADRGVVRGSISGLQGDGFARYGVASLVTPTTVVSAEVSWLTPQSSDVHGDYRLRITGTRGTAEVFWARGRVEVVTDERAARDLELPPGRRPAQDALDAFTEGRPGQGVTDQAFSATRLALLAQDSADRGGAPNEWTRR